MSPCLAIAGLLALAQAEVRVIQPDGQPAPAAKVAGRVGLARFDLADDFACWRALQALEAETDADGAARFDGVEPGARLTVFARQGRFTALAEGEVGAPIALTLEPTGELAGKVSSRHGLRGYTLRVIAARGGETKSAELDSKGAWELDDLPPGEVELEVRYGNWLALREMATVKAGKKTKVRTLKIGDEFLLGADPLVDARRIRLVDADGDPVAGRKMPWSAPHMDGWMASDEEGEIAMVGGGVMIGPPPFVLRLGWIGIDQDERFLGRLVRVKSGVAVVEVGPRLEPLVVRVTRAGRPLERFQLFAVSGGGQARVWDGKLEAGAFRVLVPAGELRLVLATPDGELHEEELEKPAGEVEHEMRLAD